MQLPAEPQVGASERARSTSPCSTSPAAPRGDLPVIAARADPRRAASPCDDFEHFTFANGPVKEGIVRRERGRGARTAERGAQPPGVHQREELTLDAAGTARAPIAEPAAGRTAPRAARRARVPRSERRGADRRRRRCRCGRRARLVGIEPDGWVGLARARQGARWPWSTSPGRPVAGAPVAGRRLRAPHLLAPQAPRRRLLRLRARRGDAAARATVLRRYDRRRGRASSARATPPADGELILQATVADARRAARRRHATTSGSPGADEWWFAAQDSDRIDVLPEKRRYEPGETARFQVRMPFREATALVTVEREGVARRAACVTLSGKEPVIEVPVARRVRAEHVRLGARRARARRRRAADRDGRPRQAGLQARHRRDPRRLARARAEGRRSPPTAPVYRVRETARRCRSPCARPTARRRRRAARWRVAAVDEGLLELLPNKSWDLLDAMMGRRGYGVRTATAQMQVVGKRHFGRKALPHGGGGGRQTDARAVRHAAALEGPRAARRRAATPPSRCRSTTRSRSFRIVAVATGGVGRFGTGATAIRSTQDLMLLSGAAAARARGRPLPRGVHAAQHDRRGRWTVDVRGARRRAGRAARAADASTLARRRGARSSAGTSTVPAGVEQRCATRSRPASAGGPARPPPRSRQQVRPGGAGADAARRRSLQLGRAPRRASRVERPADALPDRGGVEVALRADARGRARRRRATWMRALPLHLPRAAGVARRRARRRRALADGRRGAAVVRRRRRPAEVLPHR